MAEEQGNGTDGRWRWARHQSALVDQESRHRRRRRLDRPDHPRKSSRRPWVQPPLAPGLLRDVHSHRDGRGLHMPGSPTDVPPAAWPSTRTARCLAGSAGPSRRELLAQLRTSQLTAVTTPHRSCLAITRAGTVDAANSVSDTRRREQPARAVATTRRLHGNASAACLGRCMTRTPITVATIVGSTAGSGPTSS